MSAPLSFVRGGQYRDYDGNIKKDFGRYESYSGSRVYSVKTIYHFTSYQFRAQSATETKGYGLSLRCVVR